MCSMRLCGKCKSKQNGAGSSCDSALFVGPVPHKTLGLVNSPDGQVDVRPLLCFQKAGSKNDTPKDTKKEIACPPARARLQDALEQHSAAIDLRLRVENAHFVPASQSSRLDSRAQSWYRCSGEIANASGPGEAFWSVVARAFCCPRKQRLVSFCGSRKLAGQSLKGGSTNFANYVIGRLVRTSQASTDANEEEKMAINALSIRVRN